MTRADTTEHEAGTRLTTGAVAATPAAVGRLRRAVAAFARSHGASDPVLGDIRLAISEAVGNVVMHAYEPGEEGRVHVRAEVAHGVLTVIVADDGHGVRRKPSSGQGLGLPLIANLAADLSIRRRTTRGMEITMDFALAPGD